MNSTIFKNRKKYSIKNVRINKQNYHRNTNNFALIIYSLNIYLLYSLAQDQSTRGGASVEESGGNGEGGGWTVPAQEEENQEGTQDR